MDRGMNMPAFWLQRWSVRSPYRLNLSEKAFHGTVIPQSDLQLGYQLYLFAGIGKKTQIRAAALSG